MFLTEYPHVRKKEEKEALHTSQLHVHIGKIIYQVVLLIYPLPKKRFLTLPNRLYIALLTLLISSFIFSLKLPLFEIIEPS